MTLIHKKNYLKISTEFKNYDCKSNAILEENITCDEAWVHYYNPEIKQSTDWSILNRYPPKNSNLGCLQTMCHWQYSGT